jgi:hypothetical protein
VPEPFRFDRQWEFAVSPETFWATVARTDSYPEWWSWLREFESDGLHDDAHAECVIQAPLPYALRVKIDVQRAVPPERVETHVTGDLEGPARLEIAPRPSGCTARLVWSLELRDSLLRRLLPVARPVMAWAHDRIVQVGVREFERVALNAAEPSG